VERAFEGDILSVVQPSEVQRKALWENLEEIFDSVRANLVTLCDLVCGDIFTSVGAQLKLVSDIPRLYRRTNREVSCLLTEKAC